MNAAARRYHAFISYSHTSDARLALALQDALRRFASRPWRRIVRVSLDKTNLSVSSALWSSVQQQLDDASFLILLASPAAADSKWVRREVEYWLAQRSVETLLIVLTDGEIHYDDARSDFDWSRTTALPPALAGAYSQEPHYLDVRWAQSERDLALRNERFRDAVADISVKLRGGRKDELIGREIQERRVVQRVIGAVCIVGLVLVLAVGRFAWNSYQSGRSDSSRRLAANAIEMVASDTGTALQLAVEAVRQWPTEQAVSALRRTLVSASARLPLERAIAMPAGVKADNFPQDGTLSRDGRLLVRPVNERRAVEVIDTASNARLVLFDNHANVVASAGISPDGTRVASVDDDGVGFVWNARSGAVAFRLHAESDIEGYARVVWSPDGRFVLAGGNDGYVQSWDAASGEKLWAHEGSKAAVTLMVVSPDSQLVATASDENRQGDGQQDISAIVWNALTGADHCGAPNCMFGSYSLELEDVAFSADSQYLITSGKQGTIVWRVIDGVDVLSVLGGRKTFDSNLERDDVAIEAARLADNFREFLGVMSVAFDAGGMLVTFDTESAARRWSPPLWGEIKEGDPATNPTSLPPAPPADGRVTSPDGTLTVRLAHESSGGGDVVETSSGQILANVRADAEPVVAAAFSPDGTWLAIADGTQTVRLRRWETIAPLARLQEQAAKMVGPLPPERRAQLITPSTWERLVDWVAALIRR